MNPENIINYKVYLCAAGFEPEIRRITIDKDVCRNYFYLKQKLVSIFPALKEAQFTISWKDQEGDTVRICTDEELSIALQEMESHDFKKIYISTRPQNENEGPVHPNVLCDGCENAIQGFRYKCVVCPNFDLCPDCERSQNHPDHPMIRIPLPMSIEEPFSRKFFHKISKHLDGLYHASERWEKKGRGDGPREFGRRRGHRSCPASATATAAASAVTDPISQLIGAFLPASYYGEASTPNAQDEPAESSNPQGENMREQFCKEMLQNLASLLEPLGANVYGNSGETSQTSNEDKASTSGEPSQGQEQRQQPAQSSQQEPTPVPEPQQPIQVPQPPQEYFPVSVQPTQAPQPQQFPQAPQPYQFPQAPQPQQFPQAPQPQQFPQAPQPQQFPQATQPQQVPHAPQPQQFPQATLPQQVPQAPQIQQPAPTPQPPVQSQEQTNNGVPLAFKSKKELAKAAEDFIKRMNLSPSATSTISMFLASKNEKVEKESSPVLDESWTVIQQNEGAAAASAAPTTTPSAPTPADPAPTPADSAPTPAAPAPADPAPQALYPAIPVMPITESGQNSVDGAMEKLIEMGFVEEEGWLRQLVENKNGNLAEVLRFLMPLPKSSKD